MNLALFLSHFPASRSEVRGGTATAVLGLASSLAAEGAHVVVWSDEVDGTPVFSPGGFWIARPPDRATPNTAGPVAGTEHGSPPEPDIAVLNGMFHPRVAALARALARRGIPYVVAPHDPYHPEVFRKRAWAKRPYWRLVERRLLTRAAAVQLLDDRHASFLTQRGVSTRTFAVPNGFDPSSVPDEDELSWAEDGPARILFMGRIDQHNKGLDVLVDAVADIAGRVDVRVTLQGPDWGDAQRLRARVRRLGLEDIVTVTAPDFTKRAVDIIAEHDIFCLPSRYEGFGLAALEAMIAARPVVVSEVAGIASHVEKSGGGSVVAVGRTDLAAALHSMLGKRCEWEAIGRKGRGYALERLTWASIARRALDAYEAVLA